LKLNQKQIEAIIKLPGPDRYDHFIKVVADWEEAWSLYQDGWALGATDEGQLSFPFWPAREYAELCALESWAGYKPESIPLTDMLDDLLPKLKRDGILPSIFPTPDSLSVHQNVDDLLADLRTELQRYE
jgi:hypothetical protein